MPMTSVNDTASESRHQAVGGSKIAAIGSAPSLAIVSLAERSR